MQEVARRTTQTSLARRVEVAQICLALPLPVPPFLSLPLPLPFFFFSLAASMMSYLCEYSHLSPSGQLSVSRILKQGFVLRSTLPLVPLPAPLPAPF